MKVLVLSNNEMGLYKFRRELLETLVAEKHKIYVSAPADDYSDELRAVGIKLIRNDYLDRRGTNPIHDLRLMNYYKSVIKSIKPDVALTYTIKPNVYGGYMCGRLGVPYIANVTGLGTSIENGGLMQKLTLTLYKSGLKKAQKVFFQNAANRDFMLSRGVVDEEKIDVLPGSGVNTAQHCYEPYPDNGPIVFTTIGRIMKDKGIEELLEAAQIIKKKHPNTVFRLIGDFDEGYENRVRELERTGIVEYLGAKKDVHSYIAESHAIIHPSYHEGMSNVLQEAASTGRPVIATDVPGCIEIFEPGITGIDFKTRDIDSLVDAIERFLCLKNKEREEMGKAGREKMGREFTRKIVVEKYICEIKKVRRGDNNESI